MSLCKLSYEEYNKRIIEILKLVRWYSLRYIKIDSINIKKWLLYWGLKGFIWVKMARNIN